MRTTTSRFSVAIGLLIGTLLLVPGCSSAGTTAASSAAPAPAASSGAAPPAAPAGTTVSATEADFSITLSQKAFTPGTYVFKVTNAGKYGHNLVIAGPGVNSVTSETMRSGGSGAVTVTLKAGSYELWCSIPGHKDQGMDVTITVA
jgi:uncharacterized cupredoxin-like copper-binding protein